MDSESRLSAARCDVCGGETAVKDSRTCSQAIRRRRQCLDCGERYTTYEVKVENHQAILVSRQGSSVAVKEVVTKVTKEVVAV